MQALFGTRTTADINLALQILILLGLLGGYVLARRKRFDRHANVQTTMVLINLFLIVFVMFTSFYGYVIAGGSTTGTVYFAAGENSKTIVINVAGDSVA